VEKALITKPENDQAWQRLDELTAGYSAAGFTLLKQELKAEAEAADAQGKLTLDEVQAVIRDILPAPIAKTRRHQTIQAILTCTRMSLLPEKYREEKTREELRRELAQLELEGVR
jgi:hypothetical protein